MSDCLFCRIVRREIPALIVAESEEFLAFRDISPMAPTHVLVIPKAHVESLSDLPDPLVAGRLLLMVADIAKAFDVAEAGYRVVFNTGDDGGQTVHHLHAHLLAGRSLQWPPG